MRLSCAEIRIGAYWWLQVRCHSGGWKHGRWALSESRGFVVPRHRYLLAGSVGLAKDFEPRLIMACFTNVSWWVVDGLLNFNLVLRLRMRLCWKSWRIFGIFDLCRMMPRFNQAWQKCCRLLIALLRKTRKRRLWGAVFGALFHCAPI